MTPGSKSDKPGERARDEARGDHHPSFAAGEWEISDQREPDERFGKSRSDGGAPAVEYARIDHDEVVANGDPENDEEVEPERAVAEPEETHESSASPAGRGEKPRKSSEREKPTPEPHTKPKASPRISKKSRR